MIGKEKKASVLFLVERKWLLPNVFLFDALFPRYKITILKVCTAFLLLRSLCLRKVGFFLWGFVFGVFWEGLVVGLFFLSSFLMISITIELLALYLKPVALTAIFFFLSFFVNKIRSCRFFFAAVFHFTGKRTAMYNFTSLQQTLKGF